jgi:hypothetical protein
VPLELFTEVGMDDTAGAIADTPGIIWGFDLGPFDALPAFSFGLERTLFPHSCCGNPVWYRSIFFRGSWADQGRIFAHPLGGQGSEWLAHVAVDLPRQGVLARLDGFRRDRREENLYVPGRAGESIGGELSLDWRRERFRLLLDAAVEQGDGWSTRRLSFTLARDFD